MAKLITPSLINAYDWARTAPNTPTSEDPTTTWSQKAQVDLYNTLNRIYPEPKPRAMQLGLEFENAVYKTMRRDDWESVGTDRFKQVVARCRGGAVQQKAKRIIDVDGEEYCIYGKIDVLKPDEIIDIKVTGSYKGKQRYLDSYQHLIYCVCRRIPHFTYIVCEIIGTDILQVQEVPYECKDYDRALTAIVEKIKEIMSFLQEDKELSQAYNEKFCLY